MIAFSPYMLHNRTADLEERTLHGADGEAWKNDDRDGESPIVRRVFTTTALLELTWDDTRVESPLHE